MPNQKDVEKFENLLLSVNRDGIEDLLKFLRKTDFYTAPASTRFHLSEEGGLLKHSLHVCDCLLDKPRNYIWKDVLKDIPIDSLIIVSLLHDICKTYMYVKDFKNQKTYDESKVRNASPKEVKHDAKGDYIWETVETYTIDNKFPMGHGSKSVIFLLGKIKLTMNEIMAINWHMGAYCDSSQWSELGQAYEKYPLALALHESDLEATYILESENAKK